MESLPYVDSIKADYMKYPVGLQARLGLFLQSNEDPMADTLMQSLVERSIYDPKVGRFWNSTGAWRWGEWKLNAHSRMLELFQTAGYKQKWLIEMKQWLVSHKQGNAWRNARQTGEAVLSFYLSAKKDEKLTDISVTKDGEKIDQGFPYFFRQWNEKSGLDNIRIQNKSEYGYGAFLIKYKAASENIKAGNTSLPLNLNVNYLRVTSDELERIEPGTIKTGDKIRVELEMRADRPMDFIVIKHNRASGFEPVAQMSGFNWRPNPHYSANYADHQALYIEHISRGTHHYQYEFFVEQEGELHSGISQIQSIYAPEFVNNTNSTVFKIKSK